MMTGILGWFRSEGHAGYPGTTIEGAQKNYMLTDDMPVYIVPNPINNET